MVNHIPWSTWAGLNQPSNQDLISWGADFFDVTTAERLDLQTIYYARANNIPVVAGTDAHGRMFFFIYLYFISYFFSVFLYGYYGCYNNYYW